MGLSRALDLILTGRSIDAKEALEWGLVNRVVACGTGQFWQLFLQILPNIFFKILGLGQAISLATSLVKFPQNCLRADRKSAYNAAFNSSLDKLFEYEQSNAINVLPESVEGAKKFVAGIGRHGKSYNLTERNTSSWEIENDHKPTSKL